MLVIKKMRNDHGGFWHISIAPYEHPNVVKLSTQDREVSARGDFLAETICRAALRSLGVEFE